MIEDVYKNPDQLLNKEYLDDLNRKLEDDNSFLLVRIGDEISYQGVDDISGIKDLLPKYGDNNQIEGGLFVEADKPMYLRQKDVTLSDGQTGTLFVITYLDSLETGMRKIMIQLMIMVTAVLLLVNGFISLYIYWIFLRPLRLLQEGTERIKEGNLEEDVEILSDDEIGEVCQSFNEMRLKLKESVDDRMHYEKENRELISNISHDLKTPLTAIKGYVEGLRDGIANTPEKQAKYIQTIANKVNDMDKLIDELTIYSRLDTNRVPYTFVRCNVSDYFGDCCEEIGTELEASQIELEYNDHLTEPAYMNVDPEQLKRVVNNIISNSVKYMAEGRQGKIKIDLYDEGDYIHAIFSDNGIGIAAKDVERIFERFYRTDESRNSKHGGSGIGLAIVKKIVEDHKGKIWAESVEGEGTTMHLNLLKAKDEENPENA